jgi:hypothetical protein
VEAGAGAGAGEGEGEAEEAEGEGEGEGEGACGSRDVGELESRAVHSAAECCVFEYSDVHCAPYCPGGCLSLRLQSRFLLCLWLALSVCVI